MIRSGIKQFISSHHLDGYQSQNVKYHLISRFVIKHKAWSKDEVIQIGIPYELDGKPEFA